MDLIGWHRRNTIIIYVYDVGTCTCQPVFFPRPDDDSCYIADVHLTHDNAYY